jgi:hypothetical protein
MANVALIAAMVATKRTGHNRGSEHLATLRVFGIARLCAVALSANSIAPMTMRCRYP